VAQRARDLVPSRELVHEIRLHTHEHVDRRPLDVQQGLQDPEQPAGIVLGWSAEAQLIRQVGQRIASPGKPTRLAEPVRPQVQGQGSDRGDEAVGAPEDARPGQRHGRTELPEGLYHRFQLLDLQTLSASHALQGVAPGEADRVPCFRDPARVLREDRFFPRMLPAQRLGNREQDVVLPARLAGDPMVALHGRGALPRPEVEGGRMIQEGILPAFAVRTHLGHRASVELEDFTSDKEQRTCVSEVETEPPPRSATEKLLRHVIDRALDAQGKIGCPGNGAHPGLEEPRAERRGAPVHDCDSLPLPRRDEVAQARSEEVLRFVPFGRPGRSARILSQEGLSQPIPVEQGLHLRLTRHTQRPEARGVPRSTAEPDGKLVHLSHGQRAVVRAVPADAPGERRQAGPPQVAVAEPVVAVGL
jgi:hypothetical protein